MRPIEMVDAGIRALRDGEVGQLSREAAAHTAMAWAALAEATVRVQDATQAPAEQPHALSGGNRTGGGLGERLRSEAEAGRAGQHARLSAIADEVDLTEQARDLYRADANSLLQQKDQWRDSARVAEAKVERVRAQLVRMTKSSDEGTRRHGTALLRILDGRGETNENEEDA